MEDVITGLEILVDLPIWSLVSQQDETKIKKELDQFFVEIYQKSWIITKRDALRGQYTHTMYFNALVQHRTELQKYTVAAIVQ